MKTSAYISLASAIAASCVGAGLSGAARAAETITYTYDVKGRLIQVSRSGTVNNGVTTQYSRDSLNNRTTVKVAGVPAK